MIKVKTTGQILPCKNGTALPSPSPAPCSHFSYSVSGAISAPFGQAIVPPSIEAFLKNNRSLSGLKIVPLRAYFSRPCTHGSCPSNWPFWVAFSHLLKQALSVFVSNQPISWFTLSMRDSNYVNMVWLNRIDDRIWKFLQKTPPERRM